MVKRFLCVLLMFLFILGALPTSAEGYTIQSRDYASSDLYYNYIYGSSSVKITGCVSGMTWGAYIPNIILAADGYHRKVSTIGRYAFEDALISDVLISEGITSIEFRAFENCKLLKHANIPNSIENLENSIFFGCTSLSNVDLGSTISTIPSGMFSNCTSLKQITIPESVHVIESNAFSSSGLVSIRIPRSVKTISSWAFSHCSSLSRVEIEEGVQVIEQGAFHYIDKIKQVYIPESVVSIGDNIFSYDGKRSVTIYGVLGSTAHTYALANNIAFSDINYKPVSQIEMVEKAISIVNGDSKKLSYTILPTNATNSNVTWKSSKPEVVSVDSSGIVRGKKVGSATITISSIDGGKTANCIVTVNQLQKPTSLRATTADGTSIVLKWNAVSGTNVKYEVQRKSGSKWKTLKTLDTTEYTDKGLKKDTKYSYRIRAVLGTTKSDFASASAKTKNPITSLKMSKKTATIRVGSTLSLKATIKPKKASDKALTWSSSDTSIAKVSTKGKVTPVSAGKATITVSSLNGKTATCVVTVKKRNPSSVSLSSAKATLYVGDTFQLSGTVQPLDSDDSLKWSSSKKAVATVSSTGLVTAKKAGKAKITVKTVNGKKKTCTITVNVLSKKALGEDDLGFYAGNELGKIPLTLAEAQQTLTITNVERYNDNGKCYAINVSAKTLRSNYKVDLRYSPSQETLEYFELINNALNINEVDKNVISTYRGITFGDNVSKVETAYGKPREKKITPEGHITYHYVVPTSKGQYELCFHVSNQTKTVATISLYKIHE